MRKSCLPTGIEHAAFGLPAHCSTRDRSFTQRPETGPPVEQWAGNPKAACSIPVGRQLFRIACFQVVAVLVTLP